jgi:poly-gamma-glutamate capsule biosynthesis protein CapA/YwtB (metallophosphatase superfamily)
MTTNASSSLRLAAIGDLLLTTRPGTSSPGRGLDALSSEVRQLFASCDVVLANLECTLPGKELVATEPRVFTSEAQAVGLAEAGINVVSLANNHAFDAGNEGFGRLTALLDRQNIRWFGAGLALSDASQPCILEINGIRLAMIGTADASSGVNSFAGPASSGVPPLDCENLCEKIRALSGTVDHILISPHWGLERFRFPSPGQIKQAHAFIDAGASMVLGHHPHVIQGMEVYRKKPIIYSLGNFFVNHVYWENGDYLTFSRFERTGCILLAELHKNEIINVQQIPVFDNGEILTIDKTRIGQRYLRAANRMLTQGVTHRRHQRESFRVRTLLPILSKLRWENLRRFRFSHLIKVLKLFSQGLNP